MAAVPPPACTGAGLYGASGVNLLNVDLVCAFGGQRMVRQIIEYQYSLLVGPVGMWARTSISPLFELAREAGGSAAGRHRRSSTYPPAVLSCRLCRGVNQGSWVMIRGELAIGRKISRHTLVFGG